MYQPALVSLKSTPGHISLTLTALLLLPVSCAWTPQMAGVIYQDAKGAVYLEEIPDLAFTASQPFTLDQVILAQALGGIQAEEPLKSMKTRKNPGVPHKAVLTTQQIKFLAPLLKAALAKAGPEHHIVFRSVDSNSPEPTLTAGTLYIHEATLYLTITHWQLPLDNESVISVSTDLPASTKMARYVFSFNPESVGGPAHRQPPGAPYRSLLTTLAIDLTELTRFMVEANTRHRAGAPNDTRQQAATQGTSKDKKGGATPSQPEAADAYRVKLLELQEANRQLGRTLAEQESLRRDLHLLKSKLSRHLKEIQALRAKKRSRKK